MRRFAFALAGLLLAASFSTDASAQFIHNPSDTPTTGAPNRWPFSEHRDWRFMFIIDRNVLPRGPFKITDLAFAPSQQERFAAQRFQVRMSHTTFNDFPPNTPGVGFDQVLGPCPIVCYEGPFRWSTTANTWVDLGLERTFGHVLNQNIAVEIRYAGGTASTLRLRTDPTIERAWVHSGTSANPFNDNNWQFGTADGPKHRLTVSRSCVLHAPSRVSIGGSAGIRYFNAPAGWQYQIAASFGQKPLDLGACRIGLSVDGLFWASLFSGPPTFTDYSGTVPTSGDGFGIMRLPRFTPLVGTCVFHAAVFLANGKPGYCSNTEGFVITV